MKTVIEMTDKELLNQALEYLEDNQHWVADGERHAYVMEYNAFIDKLKQALAQPEQEPLGYIASMALNDLRCGIYCDVSVYGEEWEETVPIYTTPPQRTWVGLTGKEVMDVTRKEGHELLDFIYEYGTASEGTDERVVAICKAIEAKLKELNT